MTKKEILDYVDEFTLMETYFPEPVRFDKTYVNPFRNDTNPGCRFYWSNAGNLIFFDGGNKQYGGDFIAIVMLRYKLNFVQAIEKIVSDFDIKPGIFKSKRNKKIIVDSPISKSNVANSKTPKKKKQPTKYKVDVRKFRQVDADFWKPLGINSSLLLRYNVYPIKEIKKKKPYTDFFKTTYQHKDSDPCYCYKIDNKIKLYRPYNKRFKWECNTSAKNIQGLSQLPETGRILIIASSMKDALCLIARGIPAIAPQSESNIIPDDIINDLKLRFNNVHILYDSDKAGIKYAQHHSQLYKVSYISLPPNPDCKDVADFARDLGEHFDAFLENIISEHYEQIDRENNTGRVENVHAE